MFVIIVPIKIEVILKLKMKISIKLISRENPADKHLSSEMALGLRSARNIVIRVSKRAVVTMSKIVNVK